ncbi:MAG: dihydrolipoamide acetyltransferase family protein [Dehalococcoidia bacterium]
MARPIHLPKIGMTMEEGTVARWLVAEGAPVTSGQPLFELETAKAIVEVEADGDGTLRQLVPAGTTLEPGRVVGALLAPGESEVPAEILAQVPGATTTAASPAAEAPPVTTPPAPGDPSGRAPASPAARRLARELGVDIDRVAGSGPGGRIVEADVRAVAEAAVVATPAHPAPVPAAVPAAAATSGGTREAYSGRRRIIGERMHESLASMAQLTLSSETRVDAAMEMLHGLNREWRTERVVVTLPALIVRACALALREHPRLNARLDAASGEIVAEEAVHVGLAVDEEAGLVVPVVRDADRRSLQEVARTVADLVERVKTRRVTPDELSGGTFTVTALDGSVVDAFTPVINPPQAGILGVGRVREVAVIEDGAVRAGRVTTLSLTFDHRVLDGAPAARFLARVAELLARPYLLM